MLLFILSHTSLIVLGSWTCLEKFHLLPFVSVLDLDYFMLRITYLWVFWSNTENTHYFLFIYWLLFLPVIYESHVKNYIFESDILNEEKWAWLITFKKQNVSSKAKKMYLTLGHFLWEYLPVSKNVLTFTHVTVSFLTSSGSVTNKFF